MERLTFGGSFCDIAQGLETPGGSFCEDGHCSQRKVWERLKQYEDTGYTPEEIAKLQGDMIQRNAELLKAREDLQSAKNTADQHAAINDTLYDSNMKLAADRKELSNELGQYCGKYKQAHEGACDGCRWREK